MNKHTLPMPVKVKPYAHQQNAFDFVCSLFGLTTFEETSSGAALLMEMGTGKSLVGLAIAGILFRFSLIERVLVVCPLSIMGVWEEELAKFADYPYSVTLLKGTIAKKKEQLANLPRSELQIVVTNYETMWRMEAELQRFHAGLIIADEGHRLKDGTSRQSKAMHRLGDRADYRLLLTGTAISNKELDIYSEYRFAAPQVFGKSFYAFRGRYFYMGGYGGYVPLFKKEMTDDFLQRLHGRPAYDSVQEAAPAPVVTPTSPAVSVSEGNGEKVIWDTLMNFIGNTYGAAGLMGNLYAESALNPKNLQNNGNKALGMTDDEFTSAMDAGAYSNFVGDGYGYGLAQWTYHSRKAALLA